MSASPILFFDTASPIVSVAVGGGEVLALRTLELRRSSERLLAMIDETLREAGVALAELGGVAAFGGPGSFTGLRIGLATALGLHQALSLRATAVPTLPILAAAGDASDGRDVTAAVDAIRGEWVSQRFRTTADGSKLETLGVAERLPARRLAGHAPGRLVGFGAARLAAEPWWPSGLEAVEPPPLAAVAARRLSASDIDWQPSLLTSPIYFRKPAVTASGP